ncbi:MAG: Lrp/AsnC family transcriptional regulator [Kordiimonadaceae bacterium]|nr:Lrp/AsnC family transcriptional regulator [Kordiimonadaceae bacterium]
MDNIDLKIIRELQKNGRITNQELADKVHLSPSPCLRRLKKLEASGVIRGYTAVVDRNLYGLPISVFAMIRLNSHDTATISQFESCISDIEEIIECFLMAGSHDYLLHIVAATLQDYELFMKEKLNAVPGIAAIESNIAFGTVKQTPILPGVQR